MKLEKHVHAHPHTCSCTMSGRLILEDLINWKKSTTPSVFILSNMAWMVTNTPVRPIPSLDTDTTGEREIDLTYFYSYILAHDSDGSILSRPLQFSEVVDELEDELRIDTSLLRPAGHMELSDTECGGVLWEREREGDNQWSTSPSVTFPIHTPHTLAHSCPPTPCPPLCTLSRRCTQVVILSLVPPYIPLHPAPTACSLTIQCTIHRELTGTCKQIAAVKTCCVCP